MIHKVTKTWDSSLVHVIGNDSGYYLSLLIDKKIDISQLEEHLKKRKIWIARNERCFYDLSHFNHTLRLSLARVSQQQLAKALTIIYQTIIDIDQ